MGIILSNAQGKLLWARRIGQDAWQFPQGGIRRDETPKQALFRELWEEVGLEAKHVRVLGSTRGWLRYKLPKCLMRRENHQPVCIGQKQIWYLLRLHGSDDEVRLDAAEIPEFDGWRWVDYWYPLKEVVAFKREVYRKALKELAPLLDSQRLEQQRLDRQRSAQKIPG